MVPNTTQKCSLKIVRTILCFAKTSKNANPLPWQYCLGSFFGFRLNFCGKQNQTTKCLIWPIYRGLEISSKKTFFLKT